MNPLDLIHLQITLEYQLSPAGQLIPFPGSSEQARYIAYHHAGGFVHYFRADLPGGVQATLGALPPSQLFTAAEGVWRALGEKAPCPPLETFVSLYFAQIPSPQAFPAVVEQEKNLAIRVEGREVAWAWSERRNERCAELAVETHPDFRRRGFARQLASAWAYRVMQSGRVALYSHKAGNEASRLLAADLGVVGYATCMAVE